MRLRSGPAGQRIARIRGQAAFAAGESRGRRDSRSHRLRRRPQRHARILVRLGKPRSAVPGSRTIRKRFVPGQLWHALRLPRRHGGQQEGVQIDLPYSNFAYSQTGTPWPVNQAVYVDYMLFGLRGYHDVAVEEMLAQYRNNQEFNGHVNGYANWVSNTPGMLYAVAQDYLLFRDRAGARPLDAGQPEGPRLVPERNSGFRTTFRARTRASAGAVERWHRRRGLGLQSGVYVRSAGALWPDARKHRQSARPARHWTAAHKLHAAIAQAFAAAAARSTLVRASRSHLDSVRAERSVHLPAHSRSVVSDGCRHRRRASVATESRRRQTGNWPIRSSTITKTTCT